MDFVLPSEFPAALIGAGSVVLVAGAVVWTVARSSHGPSRGELLALGLLAASGLWSWSARSALAERLFSDRSGIVEEASALRLSGYADCAAYVAGTGKGHDDGAVCTIDVVSSRGRYVSARRPPA